MNNLPLIIDALDFAAQAQREQRRKGADATPYIAHPIALARILTVEGGIDDPVIIAAALLHDTVEDCGVTPAQLALKFGQEVSDVVAEVTDDKSLPKAKRKELQVEHAANVSDRAKLVKLADKIANVRDIGQNPPADWSLDRKHEYANWAKRVVEALGNVSPRLESAFEMAWTAVVEDRRYCGCMTPPFYHWDFEKRELGVTANYGEIQIETCKSCGTKWLRYFWEHEGFTASGRWYKGIIDDTSLPTLKPENCVKYLESLPWYIYGGSYFNTMGKRGSGSIKASL
jgi:guanosine-3',5'-bis(diphosphate) 3'-pyrophosphohydrolase